MGHHPDPEQRAEGRALQSRGCPLPSCPEGNPLPSALCIHTCSDAHPGLEQTMNKIDKIRGERTLTASGRVSLSRVDQQVAIGMAAEAMQPPGSGADSHRVGAGLGRVGWGPAESEVDLLDRGCVHLRGSTFENISAAARRRRQCVGWGVGAACRSGDLSAVLRISRRYHIHPQLNSLTKHV